MTSRENFESAHWLLALVLAACGASDDAAGDAGSGPRGPAAAGAPATAPGGGSGGNGGAGGTGGTTGATTPLPGLTCGDAACAVSQLAASFGIIACCTVDDECGGMALECLPLNQAGMPDADCPGGMDASGMYPLSGCCRPDGQCGLDYSAVGWGCVERERISAVMARDTPLQPMACVGDEDAGT